MRLYVYKTNDGNSEPLAKEKIELLIRSSELNTDDFIFVTDLNEWKRIFELEEFAKFILRPEPHEIKKWFIYNEAKKNKTGPFSTKEIVSKLSFGEVSESTYLWAYEIKEWKKLKDINDFNKQKDQGKEDATTANGKDLGKSTQVSATTPQINTTVSNNHKEEEKISKRVIKKAAIRTKKLETNKRAETKPKKKHHLQFIPEFLFGLLMAAIAYLKKDKLGSQDIYFYGIAFVFITIALLIFIKARKKIKE